MTYTDDKSDFDFLNRMKSIPGLRERVESIMNVVENTSGSFERADDAEKQTIIETRKLGNEILCGWGKKQAEQKAKEFLSEEKQKKTAESK